MNIDRVGYARNAIVRNDAGDECSGLLVQASVKEIAWGAFSPNSKRLEDSRLIVRRFEF